MGAYRETISKDAIPSDGRRCIGANEQWEANRSAERAAAIGRSAAIRLMGLAITTVPAARRRSRAEASRPSNVWRRRRAAYYTGTCASGSRRASSAAVVRTPP